MWIDVQAALEFDLGIQSTDEPLGLAGFAGRGLYVAVVNPDVEQVFVRHHDFVVIRIDCDRAIGRVRIANHALRLALAGIQRTPFAGEADLRQQGSQGKLARKCGKRVPSRRDCRTSAVGIVRQIIVGNQRRGRTRVAGQTQPNQTRSNGKR